MTGRTSRVGGYRRPSLHDKRPSLLLEASAMIVPLVFAINPVVAMVLRAERCFRFPEAASRGTLALPLLLVGLYPSAFYLALSVVTISEGRFASIHLGLCTLAGIVGYRTKGARRRR
jgi:hypothetical protein